MTDEVPRRRASDRQTSFGSRTPEPAEAPECGGPEGNPASTLDSREDEHPSGTERRPARGSRERRQRDIEWNGPERRTGGPTSRSQTERYW
jgi:hypothetical protein